MTQPRVEARILVVEDDQFLLQLLVELLRRQPYDVRSADELATAQALLAEEPVDLIVSDLIIASQPVGLDLISTSLASGRCRAGLLVSGHPRSPVLEPRLNPGISFLQKPFTRSELFDAVSRLLDDAPAAV